VKDDRLPDHGELIKHYLVAIHHPDDYDASREDEAMHSDIDELNREMEAAGVRVFVAKAAVACRAAVEVRGIY